MPRLPDSIRYSETLQASPAELIEAVREQGFEGIVAKRRDSLYEPGRRSGAWQKMRVLQSREFVIGGYTPGGRNFDGILIGHYERVANLSTSPRYVPASRRLCAMLCSSGCADWRPIDVHSRTCLRPIAVNGAKD